MQINEFQKLAVTTAIYPRSAAIEYPLLGLLGEVGEIANKAKKRIRDNAQNDEALAAEVGDAFWYVCTFANDLDQVIPDHWTLLPKYLPSTLNKAVRNVGREVGWLCDWYDTLHGEYANQIDVRPRLITITGNLHAILYHLNMKLDSVLQANIDKLFSRKERGTLQGEGDNR